MKGGGDKETGRQQRWEKSESIRLGSQGKMAINIIIMYESSIIKEINKMLTN